MKKIVTTLGLMVLTGVLFFACAPAFEPPGASQYDIRSAYAQDRYTTITLAAPTLTLQPTSGIGVTIQTFTITTNTYKAGTAESGNNRLNLDIKDKKIPGLSIRMVSASDNYRRYTLSTSEIDYTALKTDVNTVQISLPLTDSALNSSRFVVFIDSKTATFNGEKILNQDQDNVVAEGDEDDFAVTGTFNNSNPPRGSWLAISGGIPWASRFNETISYTSSGSLGNIENGTAYQIITNLQDTGSENRNLIDTEALKTAFKAQKLVSGKWEDITVTPTYHSAGGGTWPQYSVTVEFSNLSDYDQIRYRVDPYYIKESGDGVGGFVHRASYANGTKDRPNDTVPHSSWNYAVVRTADKGAITNVTLPSVSVSTFSYGGTSKSYYVDVTLSVGSSNSAYWAHGGGTPAYTFNTPDNPEIPGSLTDADYRDNLKIFHRKGAAVQDLLDLADFRFEKRAPLTFRIYLPENFAPFDTASSGLDIYVLPGLSIPVPVTGGGTQSLKPTGNNFLGAALDSTSRNYTW